MSSENFFWAKTSVTLFLSCRKHCEGSNQSAYEVKNSLCLFERPFKIQKNGVFLLKYLFFVLEMPTFFYYANLIRDDVILFASKMWKILNKRYLWKYWSSVLQTWHYKCTSQKKQNDTLTDQAHGSVECICYIKAL